MYPPLKFILFLHRPCAATDEQGNRRVGGMTDAEAQQCVRDIIAWFKRSSDLEISEGSEESMQPLIKSLGEAL